MALDGVSLSADERTYIVMLANSIYSKDILKTEYLSGDFIFSEDANKAQASLVNSNN